MNDVMIEAKDLVKPDLVKQDPAEPDPVQRYGPAEAVAGHGVVREAKAVRA